MLKSIDIDLTYYRWEAFDSEFKNLIDGYSSGNPYPPDDRSGSWSRLHYLLEESYLCGFTYEEIEDHLKQPNIQ